MLYISPYKLGSASAKALADSLNIKRISGEKLLRSGSVVINWGHSSLRQMGPGIRVINSPRAVSIARDKILTLSTLTSASLSVPEWTQDSDIARQWLSEGATVYGRASTQSSQGMGINIFTPDSYFIDGLPLYTKGVDRPHEYRVHVFNGEIIDYTRKRRRSETEVNEYIRNSSNGWVFCREGVRLPLNVASLSILGVKALGLHFGAVDVLYKRNEDRAYILEINTAPGIEGTTLDKYVEAIGKII